MKLPRSQTPFAVLFFILLTVMYAKSQGGDGLLKLADRKLANSPVNIFFSHNSTSNNFFLAGSSKCIYASANSKACSSPYREPTGRCTTTASGRKTWGMAGTPYTRILSPKYEDANGKRQVTELFSRKPLKSPRLISTTVFTTNVVLNSEGISAHTMQWGQLIAHEFTQLAEAKADTLCCADEIAETVHGRGATSAQKNAIRESVKKFRGDICQQIELSNDPVYKGPICMNSVRSKSAPNHNCARGPRQQMNSITHVFDASNVYGSSQAELNRLRDSSGGRLKTQTVNGVSLPPQDTRDCSASKLKAKRCPFLGGDARINTTPNLISAITAFVNKHNQIAKGLATQNPQWDNEKLFQETRKIISAIQSNIHFYEYLPIVLGSATMKKYRLSSYAGYDRNTNPSILNELAGAAFRFGHSSIDGFFTVVKDNGQSDFIDLKDNFFNSDLIYKDGVKQCAKGLSEDKPWDVDRHYPSQMRDFLFNKKLDIVSININRGRDHGFRSYVDYRKYYRLSVPQSWKDLEKTHPKEVVDQLKTVYTSVKDVELYIAGVMENPLPGALVGELFANIIGDGFSRSKKGDRFYFESSQSGLTAAQVASIKRYTYAQVLCEGLSMDKIVNKVFFRNGQKGAREVSCSSFPSLDFKLWKTGGSSNSSSKKCYWKVTKTGKCCKGRRTVYRTCVNSSSSCRCPGSSKASEKCSGSYNRRSKC